LRGRWCHLDCPFCPLLQIGADAVGIDCAGSREPGEPTALVRDPAKRLV
jgi:hypothetical protein